jgi:glycerate dehydrogenase
MRGVFLDRNTMGPEDLDFTGLESTLPHWRYYDRTESEAVEARIADANVVVVNKVVLSEERLKQATGLRLICVAATGTDNVDLEAANRLRLPVCNVRGYATSTVVNHVFSLILALSRRLIDYHRAVRGGRWIQAEQFCLLDYPLWELAGRTIGIVGYGALGRGVARMAEAFGMRVMVAERAGGPKQPARIPLDRLLSEVDVLTLHCPLTPATCGLIGTEALARMQPHALLINTARGGIVDEAALAGALRNGIIGGAGVDVLTTEPPTQGNPLLAHDLPNLIVTPHVAWASREARQRVLEGLAENIVAYLDGTPRNVVNNPGL